MRMFQTHPGDPSHTSCLTENAESWRNVLAQVLCSVGDKHRECSDFECSIESVSMGPSVAATSSTSFCVAVGTTSSSVYFLRFRQHTAVNGARVSHPYRDTSSLVELF